jgi:hypothetical protein
MKTSAQLREELAKAELRERTAKGDAIKATPVVFTYSILPTRQSGVRYHKLYDDSIQLYEFRRHCMNKEEAKAAGHSTHEYQEGGATWLYNTLSEKIICSVGGGTMFISADWFARQREDKHQLDDIAFEAIGAFLSEHPEGGDITEIVTSYRVKYAALCKERAKDQSVMRGE